MPTSQRSMPAHVWPSIRGQSNDTTIDEKMLCIACTLNALDVSKPSTPCTITCATGQQNPGYLTKQTRLGLASKSLLFQSSKTTHVISSSCFTHFHPLSHIFGETSELPHPTTSTRPSRAPPICRFRYTASLEYPKNQSYVSPCSSSPASPL